MRTHGGSMDGSSVKSNGIFYNGKAQPGSFRMISILFRNPVETLKNLAQMLFADPFPII